MQARNSGHIINLGSVAGREPYIGGAIYCATKHAVNAFSGVLLRELVNTKIRVTEIQPGVFVFLNPRLLSFAKLKISSYLPTGMVETEFSMVRFQGDKSKADQVYEGLQPRQYIPFSIKRSQVC
jgi:3-hydroxy acid dehydrogenase / malonic semialdehyde reductase